VTPFFDSLQAMPLPYATLHVALFYRMTWASGTGFGRTATTPTGSSLSSGGWASQGRTGLGSTTPSTGFGRTGTATSFGRGTALTVRHQAVIEADSTGIFNRILSLRSAYDPQSPGYRFCFVFYNMKQKEDEPFPTRPQNIPESEWVDLCMNRPDPDHLVPCAVHGFAGLEERHRLQEGICKQMEERMRLIHSKLREMSSFYATELRGPFQQVRQKIAEINEQLSTVYEIDDVQRRQGVPMTEAEHRVHNELEAISRNVSAQRYAERIEKLKQKLNQGKRMRGKGAGGGTLDEGAREKIVDVVEQHEKGLEALQKATRELHRITDLWKKDVDEGPAVDGSPE
jgi:hypothetical protein